MAILAAGLSLTACVREGGLAPLSQGGDALSGGGAFTVAQGDTLYSLARRYQVPTRDLIEINRLTPPYVIEPGQRLVLPTSRQYIVKPGDTLYGVSRMFGVDVSELTRLNNLSPPYAVNSGQALRLPAPTKGYGGAGSSAYSERTAAAAPPAKFERTDLTGSAAAAGAAAGTAVTPYNPAAPSVVYVPGREPLALGSRPPDKAEPQQPPPPAQTAAAAAAGKAPPPAPPPVPTAAEKELQAEVKRETVTPPAKPAAPVKAPESTKHPEPAKPAPPPPAAVAEAPPPAEKPVDADPPPRGGKRFLMPVDGKLISGYGSKAGGLHNDGLNIGAAKGTPVVAADNGVVAYAGSELRGFGNLLLIRHADGWITAYAHLQRYDVARGAEVKRGQKIGTVGQTGGVAEPQLHFELRKGNQAVDPRGMM